MLIAVERDKMNKIIPHINNMVSGWFINQNEHIINPIKNSPIKTQTVIFTGNDKNSK